MNCGCSCMQSCQYGVIQFDQKAERSHKCDLCYDQIVFGEKPVCVDICLTNALSFGEWELLQLRADTAGKQIIKKRSTQSILYIKSSD